MDALEASAVEEAELAQQYNDWLQRVLKTRESRRLAQKRYQASEKGKAATLRAQQVMKLKRREIAAMRRRERRRELRRQARKSARVDKKLLKKYGQTSQQIEQEQEQWIANNPVPKAEKLTIPRIIEQALQFPGQPIFRERNNDERMFYNSTMS